MEFPGSTIVRVLFDQHQIERRVEAMAQEITRDHAHRRPLVVGVLNGCFPLMADLVRHLAFPLEVDFMAVSSYGNDTQSSGVVRILKDLGQAIEGRHVVMVEDIVDTGLTLKYLLDTLEVRQPASVSVCTLLNKPQARREPVQVDYVGFSCPDQFVVGYGLDYAGLYRNLPYIGVLNTDLA